MLSLGLEFLKFHQILHIIRDILNQGCPNGLDTGANEKGHKKPKTATTLSSLSTLQARVFEKELNELVEPLTVSLDRLRIKWERPKRANSQVFSCGSYFESLHCGIAKLVKQFQILHANQGVFQVHTRHGDKMLIIIPL